MISSHYSLVSGVLTCPKVRTPSRNVPNHCYMNLRYMRSTIESLAAKNVMNVAALIPGQLMSLAGLYFVGKNNNQSNLK